MKHRLSKLQLLMYAQTGLEQDIKQLRKALPGIALQRSLDHLDEVRRRIKLVKANERTNT